MSLKQAALDIYEKLEREKEREIIRSEIDCICKVLEKCMSTN